MKDKILELRALGKSYRQIEKILGCSRANIANIAYHCSPDSRKQAIVTRTNQRRRDRKQHFVNLLGGKCCVCDYNKVLSALEFHHIDSSQKERVLNEVFRTNFNKALEEVKKCILVCANCHREIHENMVSERDVNSAVRKTAELGLTPRDTSNL